MHSVLTAASVHIALPGAPRAGDAGAVALAKHAGVGREPRDRGAAGDDGADASHAGAASMQATLAAATLRMARGHGAPGVVFHGSAARELGFASQQPVGAAAGHGEGSGLWSGATGSGGGTAVGCVRVCVSISHDAGVAAAVAVALRRVS
jgi:hypothetical protein